MRAWVLAGLLSGCATAVGVPTGGAGGGGSGGSAGGMGGTPIGPCTTASDCGALTGSCVVGVCINGTCETAPQNDGEPCNDGKTCTTNDSCSDGVCTGPLKFCPSSNGCTIGTCDVDSDSCVEVPGNDGQSCADDDACTPYGECSGGTCVGSGQADCSFLDDDCMVGKCDSATGCYGEPKNDGAPCNDGLFCTETDQCVSGTCVGQPKLCAPPNDPCKTGMCDEGTDACIIVTGNEGAACDDGSPCTTGTTCVMGDCSGGSPSNPGAACDDGDPCSTSSVCQGIDCVPTGMIAVCADGDMCCPAGCDELSDGDCQPACCGDFLNQGAPSNNCSQGATWIAWKYVPTCSFPLETLALHTDSGSVAVLSDSNDFPGAVLFQGPLGPPDPQGWLTASVSPAVNLVGGQTYWIAENVGVCSIAAAGVDYPYYGSFGNLAGPWDGPFVGGHAWTFKAHPLGCQ